jgi:hypothetical protein
MLKLSAYAESGKDERNTAADMIRVTAFDVIVFIIAQPPSREL